MDYSNTRDFCKTRPSDRTINMFRRGRQERRTEGRGRTGEPEGDEIRGEGRRERDKKRQKQGEQAAEEEEEEYPDNVDVQEILEEYEEEDVYMVIELPPGYDAETISASSLTVKASILFLHYSLDLIAGCAA